MENSHRVRRSQPNIRNKRKKQVTTEEGPKVKKTLESEENTPVHNKVVLENSNRVCRSQRNIRNKRKKQVTTEEGPKLKKSLESENTPDNSVGPSNPNDSTIPPAVTTPPQIVLSPYDCDLNLRVSENGLTGTPILEGNLIKLWAGARCTYGFRSGKLFFQAKFKKLENIESKFSGLRVGWTLSPMNMGVGQAPISYLYENNGMTLVNEDYSNYSPDYVQNDIITAHLDLDGDSIQASFTVNSHPQGTAFRIDKAVVCNGAGFYPTIMALNVSFTCNFGQESPWAAPISGYSSLTEINQENLVRGPEEPQDPEIICLCGLPGSGKTTWALKYAAQNPTKLFNIIGATTVLNQMKIMGVVPSYGGKHDRWWLADLCADIVCNLLRIAANKKRNYILDQRNVIAEVRIRKMKRFRGFKKTCVVVVPQNEAYEVRKALYQLKKIQGEDTRSSLIAKMKERFTLPTERETFDEIKYIEMDKPEAEKLVAAYNRREL